jgi:O-antigen/teichoic acid export membrane protein
VIASAQAEMWLRLILAAIAWQTGLGLPGVAAAISLSVLAGLAPLWSLLPARPTATLPHGLIFAALPFAALQAGQVILMDGDVLLAQTLLGPEAAGHLAPRLFQRIQFFACFSLAVVLLPAVTSDVAAGRSPLRAAAPVFALYAAVTLPVIAAAFATPTLLVTTLVGPAFLPAADLVPTVALAAAAFTLSFLLATYLSAIKDRSGIWLIALACPVQLVAMSLAAQDLASALTAKLACQLALAALLLLRAARRSLSPAPDGASCPLTRKETSHVPAQGPSRHPLRRLRQAPLARLAQVDAQAVRPASPATPASCSRPSAAWKTSPAPRRSF